MLLLEDAVGMTWLQNLISAILVAFTNLGTAILNFIKQGFITLFLETSEQGVITGPSALAFFMFFLIGVSLVIGLTTLIFRLMRNKGNI